MLMPAQRSPVPGPAWDDALVTYPNPWPAPVQAPQPGVFPLRPLRIGEILGFAMRIAWSNALLLVPIALVAQVLAAAAQLGILSAFGDLQTVAGGSWSSIPARPTQADLDRVLTLSSHVLAASGFSLVVALTITPIVAGLAASGAAIAATRTTRDFPGVVARMRGRWWSVIATSLLTGLCVFAGLLLLVVPGIIVAIALIPSGPVAAIEGARPVAAVKRAAALSKGFRPRLLGVYLLAVVCAAAAGLAFGAVVGALIGGSNTVGTYVVIQIVGAVFGGLTGAWTATVVALLYIDLRMRREGLADSLRRAALERSGQ